MVMMKAMDGAVRITVAVARVMVRADRATVAVVRVMARAVKATVAEARVTDVVARGKVMARVKVMAAVRATATDRAVRVLATVKARAVRVAAWVRDRARAVMARAWGSLDVARAWDPAAAAVWARVRAQARAVHSSINTSTVTATAVVAAWDHVTVPDRVWARAWDKGRASNALCRQHLRVHHRLSCHQHLPLKRHLQHRHQHLRQTRYRHPYQRVYEALLVASVSKQNGNQMVAVFCLFPAASYQIVARME
jgi:hypothetical protein